MILLHEEQQRASQRKISKLKRRQSALQMISPLTSLGILGVSVAPIAFLVIDFSLGAFLTCTAGVVASQFGLHRLRDRIDDTAVGLEVQVRDLERA